MASWQWILFSFCLSVSFPTFNFNFFSSGSRILAWWVFLVPFGTLKCLSIIFWLPWFSAEVSVHSYCSSKGDIFFSSGWYKYFLFIFGFQQLESYWPSWDFLCFGFTELLEFLGWHLLSNMESSHASFLWILLLALLPLSC